MPLPQGRGTTKERHEPRTLYARHVFCRYGDILSDTPLQAEMYVAGQVGANIPNSLSSVEINAFGVTLGASDLSLQNS